MSFLDRMSVAVIPVIVIERPHDAVPLARALAAGGLTTLEVTMRTPAALEAISLIFQELHGTEGILVASKIADQAGITRSVIVNALRKFESAGLIETKSLGMKGTYIRVLNPMLFEELKKRS